MGTNYRAACRAKSTKDFIYKLQVVEEETDEKHQPKMRFIYKESETVLKIIVASIKTAQKKITLPVTEKSKIKNPKSKTDE